MVKLHARDDACQSGNNYNGEDLPARISAVFVIFAVSALGSFLPLVTSRCPSLRLPSWCFFVTRYFGSGVIVATAFIHLLAEGNVALSNPCLGGIFDAYPWSSGIALMGVFVMFLFDIVAHKHIQMKIRSGPVDVIKESNEAGDVIVEEDISDSSRDTVSKSQFLHTVNSTQPSTILKTEQQVMYIQIVNAFVLEFGIVFHSVFVGLSLAIAGDEFKALYVAIAFHQMFEGLGLGTRFAMTQWPKNKGYYPWLLSLAYSLTTPVAIAIGIGVRKTYPPGSRTALITTGVFDSICAGVLIYNSLVDLMAYDFMYSGEFDSDDNMNREFGAFFFLSLGGFAMALIGRWA
ncbi:Zinc/iron permease [Scheffersomyces xylosifermentans]|uniref:Zinc/iron permease n=1 Tax=Scheffersomyces xylosifermentans TaxID=1304137 RepID=UPI00315D4A3F